MGKLLKTTLDIVETVIESPFSVSDLIICSSYGNNTLGPIMLWLKVFDDINLSQYLSSFSNFYRDFVMIWLCPSFMPPPLASTSMGLQYKDGVVLLLRLGNMWSWREWYYSVWPAKSDNDTFISSFSKVVTWMPCVHSSTPMSLKRDCFIAQFCWGSFKMEEASLLREWDRVIFPQISVVLHGMIRSLGKKKVASPEDGKKSIESNDE